MHSLGVNRTPNEAKLTTAGGAKRVNWKLVSGKLPSGKICQVRKDVREFIRRLEAVGLTVEPTPGHYRVLRDGKPLRKANGMPFMLPFSPDTIRWRRSAIVELRKLGIDV